MAWEKTCLLIVVVGLLYILPPFLQFSYKMDTNLNSCPKTLFSIALILVVFDIGAYWVSKLTNLESDEKYMAENQLMYEFVISSFLLFRAVLSLEMDTNLKFMLEKIHFFWTSHASFAIAANKKTNLTIDNFSN